MNISKPFLSAITAVVALAVTSVASVFLYRGVSEDEGGGDFTKLSAEDVFNSDIIKEASGDAPKISSSPLWSGEGHVALSGDTAVVATKKDFYEWKLTAANLEDGSERWSIPVEDPLPGREDAMFEALPSKGMRHNPIMTSSPAVISDEE